MARLKTLATGALMVLAIALASYRAHALGAAENAPASTYWPHGHVEMADQGQTLCVVSDETPARAWCAPVKLYTD